VNFNSIHFRQFLKNFAAMMIAGFARVPMDRDINPSMPDMDNYEKARRKHVLSATASKGYMTPTT
jgi:hypothetical protein